MSVFSFKKDGLATYQIVESPHVSPFLWVEDDFFVEICMKLQKRKKTSRPRGNKKVEFPET